MKTFASIPSTFRLNQDVPCTSSIPSSTEKKNEDASPLEKLNKFKHLQDRYNESPERKRSNPDPSRPTAIKRISFLITSFILVVQHFKMQIFAQKSNWTKFLRKNRANVAPMLRSARTICRIVRRSHSMTRISKMMPVFQRMKYPRRVKRW